MQSGWLRASHRALDRAASTELPPVHTHTEADRAALPDGELTLVRVPLFPFGHAFRAGSRVRIVVQPPGGNRPRGRSTRSPAAPTVDGSQRDRRGGDTASKVVLPVVRRHRACRTRSPACPSAPRPACRAYRAAGAGAMSSRDGSALGGRRARRHVRGALRGARPARGDRRGHPGPRPRDDRLLARRRRGADRARPRHAAGTSTPPTPAPTPTASRPTCCATSSTSEIDHDEPASSSATCASSAARSRASAWRST